MTIDRLAKLAELTGTPVGNATPVTAPYGGETDADPRLDEAQTLSVKGKAALIEMAEHTAAVEKGIKEWGSTPDATKRDALQKSIEGSLQAAESIARDVTGTLQTLQTKFATDEKLATTQLAFLTRKLSDQTNALWKVRNTFTALREGGMRQKVQSNFLVRTGNVLPEDVVDAIVGGGSGREQLMRQSVNSYGPGGNISHVRILLEIAEETQREVLKIEREIEQLWQVFHDCQVLLLEQGDLLDDILLESQRANRDIQKGTVELKQAVKLHKSIRKKNNIIMCCVVMIIVAVVVAVGTPLALMQA